MSVVPRSVVRRVSARRPAALAAAVGLVLAAAGCATGGGQDGSAPTTEGSARPAAAASGGPADLPTFDPSSAVARYADGFPPDLFPVPEGATLLASSARPAGGGEQKGEQEDEPKGKDGGKAPALTQVTLNLASQLPTEKVMEQARTILVGQGFEEIEAPDAGGLTAQTAFLRTTSSKAGEVQESLVVGVLDDGERRLATISGTVKAP
ncbi:hypothetical protein GCM10010102_36330 [Promicromonospora citrea]|uniref:LytR cell envelope-related transcriptional attenuator n=2 Tax=Promicromonospora citrea TaxID=43677 RepID=A0A8H9L8E0_9MICO|nr:hypothetical protein GCM10010102_36330 [Promicromonospora citrea]